MLQNTIHWFRKGLRLHDNPALMEACDFVRSKGGPSSGARVYPLFILDPAFCSPETIGVNRYSFLLESLSDLDSSLRRAGSMLFVAKGKPEELLPRLADEVMKRSEVKRQFINLLLYYYLLKFALFIYESYYAC